MTEKGERVLIKSFVELFNELPPYNGKVRAELFIQSNGDVSIRFNNPIRVEISKLFRKEVES